MQKTFDRLIDSFIANKVGIAEEFLSPALAGLLKQHLTALYAGHSLQNAGTGNEDLLTHNKLLRGDIIYWLDRKHDNTCENEFLNLIDHFVRYLNTTCYTGITGYEFHFALYQTGSFYKRHLDQFRNNPSRQYSMILYLNDDWREPDGGELLVHQVPARAPISPTSGKMVFFQSSELEHEVLVTNKPRMSVTGWLKK